MTKIIDDILAKSPKNFSLGGYTTLKIGGEAEIAFFPSDKDQILAIKEYLYSNNKQMTVIGAGSNLLISSNGVSGGIVLTNNLDSYEFLDDDTIKVGSGVKSVKLAKLLLNHSLSGLEFLVGIPGSVGGAVTMNSSAHGQSIKDVIQCAEVLDMETGNICVLDKSLLELDYRQSFVKNNRHFILNATFCLNKDDAKAISDRMEFHLSYRTSHHPPLTEPNAGSTFRNPAPGVYIGKLLEQLDAKSWTEGGAKISSVHANFVVNTGNATSLDVSRLMDRMYGEINRNFGYKPIAEIRFIGNKTEEEEAIWKNFTVH